MLSIQQAPSRNTPSEDLAAKYANIPSYKQFWPWFLFLLPASAVVAGIITLFIAQDMGQDRFLDGYQKLGRVVVSRQASDANTNVDTPTSTTSNTGSSPQHNEVHKP